MRGGRECRLLQRCHAPHRRAEIIKVKIWKISSQLYSGIVMDYQDAIRLSEHPEALTSVVLGGFETPNYMLLFKGKKSGLNSVVRQLPSERVVYWRECQIDRGRYQKLIIEDAASATLAKMFSDGHEVRPLTIKELALARNEIHVPWLPDVRNYLDDRAHDERICEFARDLRGLGWGVRQLYPDLRDELSRLETLALARLRGPSASEQY
jgi:hypothetical protein